MFRSGTRYTRWPAALRHARQQAGQRKRRWLVTGAAVLSLCGLVSSPASSRPWRPTPQALALYYTQILDNRGNGDIVFLWWLVPEISPETMQNAKVRTLFNDYVVLGIAHARASAAGTVTFQPVEAPQAKSANGEVLELLAGDNVPPAVAGALTAMEGVLRQTVGPFGRGMRWFVFAGGGVHSCTNGGLLVSFAGETYSYKTPIPGCRHT